jgi:hypothetical protein
MTDFIWSEGGVGASGAYTCSRIFNFDGRFEQGTWHEDELVKPYFTVRWTI